MPDITQITDSINKTYVELPDGTFAEKIVVVNSDGTDISGGGGGGTDYTIIQSPLDGSTLTITLSAPTLGKAYRYADQYDNNKSGTVRFVPTLLPNQDTAYFIGTVIQVPQGISAISAQVTYDVNLTAAGVNLWEIVYTGELVFEGITFAIYNTNHFKR